MVSLLEKRVEILADIGINDKVAKDTWDKVITNMLINIKSKNLSNGFCIAIKDCSDILQKDFPGHHDKTNEVSNKIILID